MSTSYHQVNSSAGMVGDLSGPLFAGNHGPEGVWASAKGPMLTPMELSYSVQDTAYNDGRVDSNNLVIGSGDGWLSHGPVMSGEFNTDKLTGPNTNLPK